MGQAAGSFCVTQQGQGGFKRLYVATLKGVVHIGFLTLYKLIKRPCGQHDEDYVQEEGVGVEKCDVK